MPCRPNCIFQGNGVLFIIFLIYCVHVLSDLSEATLNERSEPRGREVADQEAAEYEDIGFTRDEDSGANAARDGLFRPTVPREGVAGGVMREGGVGEMERSASIGAGRKAKQVLYQVTKVPPPTDIQLLFINISSVMISWKYPSGDDALSIGFLVQVSHDGALYQDISGLLKERVFVFDGMLISGYYQFRVMACFVGVASEPAVTDYFINGVTAPPGPPVNIQLFLVSFSDVSLEWDGPSTPTPLLYIIYWGEDPANLAEEERIYQSTHMGFQGLPPDTTFYFRLRADISGRLSVLSEIASITTPPAWAPNWY